eukprot:EG_transcript_49195
MLAWLRGRNAMEVRAACPRNSTQWLTGLALLAMLSVAGLWLWPRPPPLALALRPIHTLLPDTAFLGHIAPDTDAVAAAIAAAALWGGRPFVAGPVNRETQWLLQR